MTDSDCSRLRIAGAGVVTACFAVLGGCAHGSGLDGDAGDGGGSDAAITDGDSDVAAEGEPWWPDARSEHVELPPPPHEPQCGDGVVDPGEECDDWNRLNGDGCDWLCRLGDGDPPPERDPDVPAYEAAGPEVLVSDVGPFGVSQERLPLTWNSTEFATAIHERPEDDTWIRFRRFGTDGASLPPDWSYDVASWIPGTELVWTGSGYGLFYTERDWGIFYLRLEEDGKPLGMPVLVEADPMALMPAADWVGDRFVLVWFSSLMGAGTCGGWDRPPSSTRVRFVGLDGSTSGDPIVIDDFTGGPPDIATGDGGFGAVAYVNGSPEHPSCAVRFVHLSADLATRTYSGILSDSHGGDVKWVDRRYVVGWGGGYDTAAGGATAACVAWFDAAGTMVEPPVCNSVSGYFPAGIEPVRVAAGDRGLALVAAEGSGGELFFIRTDRRGVAVAPPIVVGDRARPTPPGPYNTVWADDGFAVLYGVGWGSPNLFLQYFTAVE